MQSTLYVPMLFATLCLSGAQANPVSHYEPLSGIKLHRDSVSFIATSTGCTKPPHFQLQWSEESRDNESIKKLGIVRSVRDRCRAHPRPVRITLPIKQNVRGSFVLINPLNIPDYF